MIFIFFHQVPSVLSESSVEHRDSTKGSSSSGVSSDLSDSDHDIDDHTKVFDFHIEASTQTNIDHDALITDEIKMSEEIINNQQQQQQQELLLEEKKSELNQLTLEIEKLSKFKSVIQAQHTSTNSRHSPDQVSSYEELDDLRV